MGESCLDPNTAAEFVGGLLSAEVAEGVEGHMAGCADCRRLIGALARSGPTQDYPSSQVDTDPVESPAFATTGVAGRPATNGLELSEGTKVGRFMVIRRVGFGGMGVVYAAYDPHLDRKVALKFLRDDPARPHNADARARLIGEAQAIARVPHPNLISVYDVGTYDDQIYVAMEFIDGVTLTRWLKKQPRTWREILTAFTDAARGLTAAHERDIIHRDFKPENVMVTSEDRVCVMDFGLARSATDGDDRASSSAGEQPSALGASLTRTGAILGTPRYMAPEQFAGEVADARSDQFSLCVALYEALFHTYPFYGETAAQLTRSLPVDDQLRPLTREVDVPAWLRAAVLRGMAVMPDERFPTMEAFIYAISPPAPTRTRWIIGAAVVAIAVASGFAFRSMSSEEDARASALQAQAAAEAEHERALDLAAEARELRKEIELLRQEVRTKQVTEQRLVAVEQRLAEKEARLDEIEEVAQRDAERRAARPRLYEERLDKGLVARYLARRRSAIESCYQHGRELNPTLGEWVKTTFTIDTNGDVIWVDTEGLRSRPVADCVRSVIARIQFPRSAEATIATYFMDFDKHRSRTSVRLMEGATSGGDEDALKARVTADGVLCDPTDPLCGAE